MAKEWFIMLMPDTDMIGTVALDPASSILDWYYKTIGCESIECVSLYFDTIKPDPFIMVVDEEGLCKDLPLNASASGLYIRSGYRGIIVGKALIGRMVIRCGEPDVGGFETSDEAMMMAEKLRRYM